jgi:transcriptional regulator of acetoin/glycerol metabolism
MIERRRGYVRAENLPATVRRFRRESEPMTFNVGTSLAELQREATIRTLRATGGNHRRAAKILGISPNTLYKALAKYGVEPNRAGSKSDPLSKDFS